MICAQLVDLKDADQFTCRMAKSLGATKEFIEAGFEHPTDIDQVKLLRKPN